jgi:hypothetical protein
MSGHRSGAYPGGKATKQNAQGQQNIVGVGTMTGTSVTAGNASLGAWTQITASTSGEFYLTGVMATISSATSTESICGVQVGIGGAGSEGVVFEAQIPLLIVPGATTRTIGFVPIVIPVRVASGARVAVRIFNSLGTLPSYGVIVYGVPYGNVEGN